MDSWSIGSLPGNDLIVDQPMVSGRHCQLSRTASGFVLKDLHSTNGTYVNGERIMQSEVSRSDTITLGTKTPMPWPENAVEPSLDQSGVTRGQVPLSQATSFRKRKYFIGVAAVFFLIALGINAVRNRPGERNDTDAVKATTSPATGSTASASLSDDGDDVAMTSTLGFQLGQFDPDEPIESIDVKIFVSDDGSDLKEPVDLHLGFGFPLRLYPVGGEQRDSALAAFPQTTSMEDGEASIAAGDNHWFRFLANPAARGQDVLRATPALLADLQFSDINQIGFASQADSTWILQGYEIKVNDQLFARHDSVNSDAAERQSENREKLDRFLAKAEPLAVRVMEGEAYEKANLAQQSDLSDLAEARQQLAGLEDSIHRLTGITGGFYPWYIERHESFQPSQKSGPLAKKVKIKLLSSGDKDAGSVHSIYLKAGGQKYLLASALDPLKNSLDFQEFTLPGDALLADPVSTADLNQSNFGIGMIGNDEPLDRVPDRAKIQRVVLEVDDQEVYDSEQDGIDRSTLAAISLVPPVHRDNLGFPIDNPGEAYQWHLWKPGTSLPDDEEAPLIPEAFSQAVPETDVGASDRIEVGDTGIRDIEQPFEPEFATLGFSRQPMPFLTRRRPALPWIVINFPRPIGGLAIPIAGPTKPVISGVRIVPGQDAVQFGKSTRVQWQVQGNQTEIHHFRVRLYPVLPHQPTPIIIPVADTTITNSSSRDVSLTPDTPDVSNVAVVDRRYLFVKPEVTALDFRGKVIGGTAAFGPIIPIFPKDRSPIRVHHAEPDTPPWAVLNTDGSTIAFPGFPGERNASSFSFGPGISTAFTASIGRRDNNPAVWRLAGSQLCQGNILESYPADSDGQWAHNIAIVGKPSGKVATQFAAYLKPLPTRMVAHVGFIQDTPSSDNQADLEIEIRILNKDGKQVLRWVETSVPIKCNKEKNKLFPIDIPILPATAQAGVHKRGTQSVPTILPAMHYVYGDPSSSPPHIDYPALMEKEIVNIGMTIFVRPHKEIGNHPAGRRQAVAIFGLRFVP